MKLISVPFVFSGSNETEYSHGSLRQDFQTLTVLVHSDDRLQNFLHQVIRRSKLDISNFTFFFFFLRICKNNVSFTAEHCAICYFISCLGNGPLCHEIILKILNFITQIFAVGRLFCGLSRKK